MTKEQVIALLKKSMKKMDWKYQYDEEDEKFITIWRAKYFFESVKIHIYVYERHMTIVARTDAHVTKNIGRVAECLARINYELGTGAMEMDCNDGEIRFFQRIPYGEIEDFGREEKNAAMALVSIMILRALHVYDASAMNLFAVMMGAESPKKAAKNTQAMIAKNENTDDDDDDDDDDDGDDDDDDDDSGIDDLDVDDDDDADDDDDDDIDFDDDLGFDDDDDDDSTDDDDDDDDSTDDDDEEPSSKRKSKRIARLKARRRKALRQKALRMKARRRKALRQKARLKKLDRREPVYVDSVATFDVMDETRNTIRIDKIIEEDAYVKGTETFTDSVKKEAASSSFHDTVA